MICTRYARCRTLTILKTGPTVVRASVIGHALYANCWATLRSYSKKGSLQGRPERSSRVLVLLLANRQAVVVVAAVLPLNQEVASMVASEARRWSSSGTTIRKNLALPMIHMLQRISLLPLLPHLSQLLQRLNINHSQRRRETTRSKAPLRALSQILLLMKMRRRKRRIRKHQVGVLKVRKKLRGSFREVLLSQLCSSSSNNQFPKTY